MRTKIVLLMGVLALSVASVAPAQGAVVSVEPEGTGVPYMPGATFKAYSTDLTFAIGLGGSGQCDRWGNTWSEESQKGDIVTEVVKNSSDPAILSGFSGDMSCEFVPMGIPVAGTTKATGSIELFSDGTGKLPLLITLKIGASQCEYPVTLSLDFTGEFPESSNVASFAGYGTGGCGAANFKGHLNFVQEDGTQVIVSYQ